MVATRMVSLSADDADGAKELRRIFFSVSVSSVVEFVVMYSSMRERNESAAIAAGMPETRRVRAFNMVIYLGEVSSVMLRNRESLVNFGVS